MTIRLICLDADDTLWHNETFFRNTFGRFAELLGEFAGPDEVQRRLDDVEHRNLAIYGYGAKGFILSMIEAAIDLAGSRLSPASVSEILSLGRNMLNHPVEMLPGVEAALAALAERGKLVLVTKGDLHHQEAKLAASGLGEYFVGVEIVSDKRADTYRRVFERHDCPPHAALMAGNSMRSDVLPALEAGAWAAFIPYEIVWAHEAADAPIDHPRFLKLGSLGELVSWLDNEAAGDEQPLAKIVPG